MWTEADVLRLIAATKSYDRQEAEAITGGLIAQALAASEPQPLEIAKRVLKALRSARYFDLLQRVADALMLRGQRALIVQRLYGQALIDRGALTAAMAFLQQLVLAAADDREEAAEARGLLGRAYKQAYVETAGQSEQRRELLRDSIDHYYSVYAEDGSKLWQGINAVALIARARRDGVDVSSWPDETAMAKEILQKVEALAAAGKADPWDKVTAGEAFIALGEWQKATRWYDAYLAAENVDAFEVASSLRQLVEVWQLGKEPGDPGAALILVLRANLMDKEGGSLPVPDARGELARHQRLAPNLEAILGKERYQPLDWYRRGLERSLAVARIGIERSQGIGTGFLVPGSALHSQWAGKWVLVTNAHVLSSTYPNAVRPEEAVVTFESLDAGNKEYGVTEILWTSPPDKLDATIALLDRDVEGVKPIPIAPTLPSETDPNRVYVIGHPRGGTLSFSMLDNLLLGCKEPLIHYRAPTEGGSSGSPVFNRQWNLLALHHAGGMSLRQLNDPPGGTYAANEGIYIGAIIKALKAALG